MHTPLWRFLIAFGCAVVLTPVARSLALRLGAIDKPDGHRKLHERPVPLFGGVAVYLALVFGLFFTTNGLLTAVDPHARLAAVLLVVAGFVCIIGCVDDLWDLAPRFKLLLQVAASLVVVATGYWVDRLVVFGYPIELGMLGIPLTVCWLVGSINALNLLDGMDGLASVVGLTTAMMMAMIATISGHPHVAMLALVLAGALAGFLVFNLPPASIYLGDSGSMVIGLVVGILGMQGSLKTTATLSLTAPAIIMSIPMLDIVMAIVRRKLSGQPIDAADRGHIHHRLLDRGLSTWQSLCVIGALCLMTGTAATASTIFQNDGLAWITAITLVMLLVITRMFGHYELSLAKVSVAQVLAGWVGRWAAAHRSQGLLAKRSSLASLPFERVWAMLVEEMQRYGVQRLELRFDSEAESENKLHVWQIGQPVPDPSRMGTLRNPAPSPRLQELLREKIIAVHATDQAAEETSSDEKPSAWSLRIGFPTEDAGVCRLVVTGPETEQPEPVDMLLLSSQLKLYGQHWALHPETISPTQGTTSPEKTRAA